MRGDKRPDRPDQRDYLYKAPQVKSLVNLELWHRTFIGSY